MSASHAIEEAVLELSEEIRGLGDATVDIAAMAQRFGLETQQVEECIAAIEALELAFGEDLPTEAMDPVPELPEGLTVLDELGRGGMGIVYRARQQSLDREVAIKVLCPGQRVFGDMLRRFRDEAKHLARLRHPNIVSIHDVGELGGNVYYTMDLIEGESLSEMVARGAMTPSQAVRLMRQVAAAIAYSHSRGILHRDLKPSNVLVDPEGTAYVVDFGLARDTELAGEHTHTGQILGTPAYMSPEQAQGQTSAIGESTDVYALGATLYECLAGRPPFRGRALADMIHAVVHEDPPPLESLAPTVPEPLSIIVHKALEKAPERRYPTVVAMREDLERFVEGRPLLAKPPSLAYRGRRWLIQHRSLLRTAMATAAAVLFVVWSLVWPRYEPWSLIASGDKVMESGQPEAAAVLYREALQLASSFGQDDPIQETLHHKLFDAHFGSKRDVADYHLSWLRYHAASDTARASYAFFERHLTDGSSKGNDVIRAALRDMRASRSESGYPYNRPYRHLFEYLRYGGGGDAYGRFVRVLGEMIESGIDRHELHAEFQHLPEFDVVQLLKKLPAHSAEGYAIARELALVQGKAPVLATIAGDARNVVAVREAALNLLCEIEDLPLWFDEADKDLDLKRLQEALGLEQRLRGMTLAERYKARVEFAISHGAPAAWLSARTGATPTPKSWADWWETHGAQPATRWLRDALGLQGELAFADLLSRFLAEPLHPQRSAWWHHLLLLTAPDGLASPRRRFGVRGAAPTAALAREWHAVTRDVVEAPQFRVRISLINLDYLSGRGEQVLTVRAGRHILTQATGRGTSTNIRWGGPIGISLPGNAPAAPRGRLPGLEHEVSIQLDKGQLVCTLRDRTARWSRPANALGRAPVGKIMAQLVRYTTPVIVGGPLRQPSLGMVLAVVEPADMPDSGGTVESWRRRLAAELGTEGDRGHASLAAMWLGLPSASASLAAAQRATGDSQQIDRWRMARFLSHDESVLSEPQLYDAVERAIAEALASGARIGHGGPAPRDTEAFVRGTAQLLAARVVAESTNDRLRASALQQLRGQRLSHRATAVLGAAMAAGKIGNESWVQRETTRTYSEMWWSEVSRPQLIWLGVYLLVAFVLVVGACWPRRSRRLRAAPWLIAVGLLPSTQLIRVGAITSALPLPIGSLLIAIGALVLAREIGTGRRRWIVPVAWAIDVVLGVLTGNAVIAYSNWTMLAHLVGLVLLPLLVRDVPPGRPLGFWLRGVVGVFVTSYLERMVLVILLMRGSLESMHAGLYLQAFDVLWTLGLLLIQIALIRRCYAAARSNPLG